MPIIDLQRSLRMLGKIRMGEKKKSANGKEYPSKLSHWRLTSPSYELLDVAASIYGGGVEVWEGAPSEGKQYQLFTETDRLRVIVPPGDNSLLQSYETWSAGGCTRRCDGVTEELSGGACMCPADPDERAALAAKGNACKITTRLKVLLPDIPDIGVWMLESHGYYAAVELAGAEEILQMAAARGTMIPAQLRIDQRTAKRNGETRRYAVPALELVTITAHQLLSGEATAVLSPGGSPALAAASAPALASPRVEPRQDAPEGKAAPNGGPPMPPLPHEDDAAGPNRVAIAARKAGLDDDGRHDLAEWVTDGRTRSSKELTDSEAELVITACARIERGEVNLRRVEGAVMLVDAKFGFADRDAEPMMVVRDADTVPFTFDDLAKMTGADLQAALVTAGLPRGGKVDELRARLAEHYGLGGEPF